MWVKPLADGSSAVALFNRGDQPAEISVALAELTTARTANGARTVRDAWRQRDLPGGDAVKMTVAAHGAELLHVSP